MWVDAAHDVVRYGEFSRDEIPRWPGWDARAPAQWHGVMTSAVAAGNGWLSHGLFAGGAPGAELVLVQARDGDGRIRNATLARALGWLAGRARDLGLGAVALPVGGDPGKGASAIHAAVEDLVSAGVTVLAASGNRPERGLVPPASSPKAITIGAYEHRAAARGGDVLWRSSWGRAARGGPRPDVIAPGAWVPAPVLPDAPPGRADEWKLLTPHYHHTDGTSVSVALACGVVACLLQRRPSLRPEGVREILRRTARPLAGPRERQGAGAIDAVAALRAVLGPG